MEKAFKEVKFSQLKRERVENPVPIESIVKSVEKCDEELQERLKKTEAESRRPLKPTWFD